MDRKSEVKQHHLKGFSYVKGKVTLPGSKSITNRVILLASLSKNKTVLKNYLESDDTKHMVAALKGLGVKIKKDEDVEIIAGGNYDDSKGYFIEPTVILR